MLRDTLAHTARTTAPVPFTAKTPEMSRRLVARYGGSAGSKKGADTLAALRRRLHLIQYDWSRVSPADRLDVVWVLWQGPTLPAAYPAFLEGLLAWLEAPFRRLQATRLAVAWAVAFDPALPSIRIVGDWLARHAGKLPDPWPWLSDTVEIFALDHGPAALAERFLAGDDTVEDFFNGLCLPAVAAGGLALEMLAVAATRAQQRIAAEPRLAARLCALSLRATGFLPDTAAAKNTRRARAVRRNLAEALLLPWQDAVAPVETRDATFAHLLCHYGDLRIAGERWTDIAAPAVAIMRRWLTERTVAAYFQLAHQANGSDRRMLADREGFWMASLNEIDDAWIAGGSRAMAALGPDQPAHGTLTGCRADQVTLLLKIAGMTIVEGTHASGESVWLPGNALAPALFRRSDEPYLPAAFASGADFASSFSHSDDDPWQNRLARYVELRSRRRLAADPAITQRR